MFLTEFLHVNVVFSGLIVYLPERNPMYSSTNTNTLEKDLNKDERKYSLSRVKNTHFSLHQLDILTFRVYTTSGEFKIERLIHERTGKDIVDQELDSPVMIQHQHLLRFYMIKHEGKRRAVAAPKRVRREQFILHKLHIRDNNTAEPSTPARYVQR